jgi:transcriptional regulator with XRE-family HTH domain
LREARLAAHLTQRAVGDLVGVSHSGISRVERGLAPRVAYQTLVEIGAVLGLDIPLRTYPNGDPVRDTAQLKLLARFRAMLPASLRHRTEVPIGIPGDGRAWDEVIVGDGWTVPVEAESRVRDSQALRRKLALKLRDSGADLMLLVVADTRHNRHVLRMAAEDFAEAFPVSGRAALAALQRGDRPSGSAIAFV